MLKKFASVLAAAALTLVIAGPVLAQQTIIGSPGANHNTNVQATGGAGGSVVGSGNSANTNINNLTQGQQQGQQQGQGQLQGQGQGQRQRQDQEANNEGNHQKIEGARFDRYAPSTAGPALTAAGTGVCLGSVSIGLMGPMAGASFGITKVDKGCEQRSAAALLYQMGYKDAAVRLLMKNDDVREAMGGDAPVLKTAAILEQPAQSEPVQAVVFTSRQEVQGQ